MSERRVSRVVVIDHEASVYGARQAAREVGAALGFDRRSSEELALVASELSTNIVRHAGRGRLEIEGVNDGAQARVELRAIDAGPAIADFDAALCDGWSQGAPIDPAKQLGRGGIGAGLGAVKRLTDELRLETREGEKAIIAVKRRR